MQQKLMPPSIKPVGVIWLVQPTYSYESKAREQLTPESLIGAIVAIETASGIWIVRVTNPAQSDW